MAPLTPRDKDLIALYGEEFIRFILAIDAQVDLKKIDLGRVQVEILADLRRVAEVHQTPTRLAGGSELQTSLASWQVLRGSSLATTWREDASGTLPDVPESDDPLEAALLEVARDVWPSLLIEVGKDDLFGPASRPVAVSPEHPSILAAAKALLRDGDLRALFPSAPLGPQIDQLDHTRLLDIAGQWMSNTGMGGGMQLMMLLPNMIAKARLWALAADDGTWDGLCRELRSVIAALRALARGEIVPVPCCVGLIGLAVPGEITIDLGNGTLRAPRPSDQSFLYLRGEAATAIYTTTFPLRIYMMTGREFGADSVPRVAVDDIRRTTLRVIEDLDLVRLAALLASAPDQRWSLTQVGTVALDPAGFGGTSYWNPFVPTVRQADLDVPGAARVRVWFDRIREHEDAKLDIAKRRVLAAASNRLDPVDALVDAVVAWENCFGTDTETNFRVTGAIACLLEPKTEPRLTRIRRLREIYAKRSRIVHGATHLSGQEAEAFSAEAVDVAIECLRRLYGDRTDLLSLEPAVRSTRLMLERDAVNADDAVMT
jgi:hypothetical protein